MYQNSAITLRPVNPDTDFPRMAELLTLVLPEPVSAEDLQSWREREPEARLRQRIAACDEQGRLIGFNDAGRDSWNAPGRFWIDVIVDPAARKRGIGKQLYADALQFAQAQGAIEIEAEIRDHLTASLQFAQKRGFAIDRHLFESTLDLATFDEARFAGVIESVKAGSIRFFSMAELDDTLETRRKLHEINSRCALNIPGRVGGYTPFEQFQRNVFEAPWYRALLRILLASGEICSPANMMLPPPGTMIPASRRISSVLPDPCRSRYRNCARRDHCPQKEKRAISCSVRVILKKGCQYRSIVTERSWQPASSGRVSLQL